MCCLVRRLQLMQEQRVCGLRLLLLRGTLALLFTDVLLANSGIALLAPQERLLPGRLLGVQERAGRQRQRAACQGGKNQAPRHVPSG